MSSPGSQGPSAGSVDWSAGLGGGPTHADQGRWGRPGRVRPVPHAASQVEPQAPRGSPRPRRERKNMNLPGVVVDLPTLTKKDEVDLVEWGVPNDIDFIAASFVRKGSDIEYIRKAGPAAPAPQHSTAQHSAARSGAGASMAAQGRAPGGGVRRTTPWSASPPPSSARAPTSRTSAGLAAAPRSAASACSRPRVCPVPCVSQCVGLAACVSGRLARPPGVPVQGRRQRRLGWWLQRCGVEHSGFRV